MNLLPLHAASIMANKMLEADKRKHMAWSFWLTLVAALIMKPGFAFAAVMLIGLLKEIWDKHFGSGFCFFDLFANVLGSTAALTIVLIISLLPF